MKFAWLAVPLTLAGCAREGGNESRNAATVAAEEGVQDLNSAIGGDELSPIPEAADDMAANSARAANAAAPANTAGVPPPAQTTPQPR